MSEKQNNQSKQPITSDQSYSFYWNYNDQLNHDRKEKNEKRGLFVYVTVLACVFFVCFAMLAVTVIWTIQNPNTTPNESQPLQSEPQATQPQVTDPQQPQQPQQPDTQEKPGTAVVIEKIKASVVLIQVATNNASGSGTGFFLREDGYIVTNYHVIEGAVQMRVTLYDGTVKDAVLVGYRAEDDLAIIKIEGTKYPPLAIGNSDVLMAGDVAIAVGNR